MPDEQHVPPHNAEAEASVLGSMLQSVEALADAMTVMTEADFYMPAHRVIFAAAQRLYIQRRPVDLLTMNDALEKEGTLDGVGGPAFLGSLVRGVPVTANLSTYMDIVCDRAKLRRLAGVGAQLHSDAMAAKKNSDEVRTEAETELFNIGQNRESNQLLQIGPAVIQARREIEQSLQNPGEMTGVDSGFTDINNMLNGFQRSDLIIVGARPSVGKTALMLNFMLPAALDHKLPVAFFALEMSRVQLIKRLLSMRARIDQDDMRKGRLSDGDYFGLGEALQELADAPIYIDDTAVIDPAQILMKCRRLKSQKQNLAMVFIDYLQLMKPTTKAENRVNAISEISRELKQLARELDLPVICASQLSRDVEKRAGRPQLSDLRDSGSIEQDADVIMFIHREKPKEGEPESNTTEIIIAKQRNGPVGSVDLHWDAAHGVFSNLQQQHRTAGPF